MKKNLLLVVLLIHAFIVNAQKASYKDGKILMDDAPIATIKSQASSGTMGMVKDFEVYSMQGQLLLIAAYASEFPEDKNDNTSYYYKLSFPGLDKETYVKLSKLGTEKSLGKLIGNSGIIKADKIDNDALFTFIAKSGKTPPAPPVSYELVQRNKSWPIEMQAEGVISQDGKSIGKFTDVTPKGSNVDYYQFSLPSGLIVAKVNFKDGPNAQVAEITTMKDNIKRPVPIPSQDRITAVLMGERNLEVIKRITKWLVSNNYL